MSRTPPRRFTVLDKTDITPHMRRVTLGGEGMHDFPADQASAYVKLMFPGPDQRPLRRTYTVRHQRAEAIDIDFVMHEHAGPASRWALHTRPGETIDIGGPGPKKRVDPTADWVLLAGDMTALPAISANLESLPPTMRGRAIIEVADQADIQALRAPAGIDLQWLINPTPGRNSAPLVDALAHAPWLDGRPGVWVACEFSTMLQLRRHLKSERGLSRHDMYISSYWKYGSDEDGHRTAKRDDAERLAG